MVDGGMGESHRQPERGPGNSGPVWSFVWRLRGSDRASAWTEHQRLRLIPRIGDLHSRQWWSGLVLRLARGSDRALRSVDRKLRLSPAVFLWGPPSRWSG